MPVQAGSKREYRVLIIEDDVTLVQVLKELLSLTFTVEAVHTAQDGMERLRKHPPADAVILDLTLPNGSGLSLVSAFQASVPEVPLIVLTGYDFPPEKVIETGAQEFLQKPVGSDALISSVARAIARHRVRKIFTPVQEHLDDVKATIAGAKQDTANLAKK